MENKRAPSETPVTKRLPDSPATVTPDTKFTPPTPSARKYSTLPGSSTLAVISNEKTNLKFGSVLSLSSFSDHSDKSSPRKYSISSQSEKPRRKLSIGEKIVKKLSSSRSVDRINERSVDPAVSDIVAKTADSVESTPGRFVATPETAETPSSEPSKVTPPESKKFKLKLLKKLSFSKKSKKDKTESSEDTMDGKNGKGKKKGAKNKWKKVNPGDETTYTAGSNPETSTTVSFIGAEREVKERQEKEKVADPPSTVTPPSPPGTNLLDTPAQSQDLDSTTDNDDYDTPMGTSPNSSQVMSPEPSVTGDEDLDKTLKSSETIKLVSEPSVPTPSPRVAAPAPTTVSDKTPSDLKKEILSITTPVVTEAGRKKHEPKSSSSSTSSADKEAAAPASAVAGKTQTNGSKEASPYSKMPDKREFLYKILVIGELGAGKTSIIKRYVHQFFSPHYRATIGVDFALKVMPWDQDTIIRLQLWDIAGQERFGNMTRVYYKEAVGAFIVFDVTRAATFDAVLKWKQDLDAKVTLPDGSPIPCVLLANKCDQPKEGIANNAAKIDEFIKENNFSAWFETSAKDNINIDDAAKTLVQKILENDKVQANGNSHPTSEAVFSLNKDRETKNGKNCAC